MDIYAYSWFQFLFPFYLWFLVGCIILACRYSQSVAKRFGWNPVAVLATLFLISYSKLLQAIIVPLSWTHLVFYWHSNETQIPVWLYDASSYKLFQRTQAYCTWIIYCLVLCGACLTIHLFINSWPLASRLF